MVSQLGYSFHSSGNKLQRSRSCSNLKAKGLQYFHFCSKNSFLRDFRVSDFVKNSLEKERMHVLVFGSNEHAANTGSMQVAILKDLSPHLKSLNVLIHDTYSDKEGLIAADIREGNIENLYHPIYHSSTEISFDLVIGQMIRFQFALFLNFS